MKRGEFVAKSKHKQRQLSMAFRMQGLLRQTIEESMKDVSVECSHSNAVRAMVVWDHKKGFACQLNVNNTRNISITSNICYR